MKNNKPTAHVAVNKSVLKIYNGKNVYLENGQEFSIELFNPTQKTVAAEVLLNDARAFQSMLLLRPGQRMFLECNPETNRKFKFETYSVSASNEQVKEAIKNNGKVEIKFYNEKSIPDTPIVYYPVSPRYVPYVPYGGPFWWNGNPFYTPSFGTINCSGSNNIGTTTTSTNNGGATFTASGSSGAVNNMYSANVETNNLGDNAPTMDFLDQDLSRSFAPNSMGKNRLRKSSLKKEDLETGRIEAGAKSDQSFSVVDMEFETIAFYATSIQILPTSQQKIEAQDIRTYCTNCGTRKKGDQKFCGNCGTKL